MLHGRAITLQLLNEDDGNVTPPSQSVMQTPAAPKKVTSETPASDSQMEVETPQEKTRFFFLKLSTVTKPYGLPTLPEVVLASHMHFQQEGMKCIPFRTHSEVCYKFELRGEVPCQGQTLQFNGYQAELSP